MLTKTLPQVTDYLLWYSKDLDKLKYRQLYEQYESRRQKLEGKYFIELPGEESRALRKEDLDNIKKLPKEARLYSRMRLTSMHHSEERSKAYKDHPCPAGFQWQISHEGLAVLEELNRLDYGQSKGLYWKRYEEEAPGIPISNTWGQMSASDLHYVVETSESVVERCILMASAPGDLVMDINCGSGTTALVSEKTGRRWITVDTSAVAISLARQRIATSTFDYYLLQDSPEGAAKESELPGGEDGKMPPYNNDVSKEFVYKRVPTVKASILAYGKKVPPTYLYDQPISKKGIIRVSSPFTVESLSPYKHISASMVSEDTDKQIDRDYITAITSALTLSGIRVQGRKEPLHVKELSNWMDDGVDMVGKITHTALTCVDDPDECVSTAISIAADDVTVSAQYIQRAAEKASSIQGVRKLIVIAFAFEASVRELVKHDKLEIIKAQANQDFQIDVGKLKGKKDDNAFVLISDPSIRIEHMKDGKITVEVIGYDTFNQTTRNVGQGGPKDIDCWMIDSDYDGTSFFARHIHFPNKQSDKQINNLKSVLACSKRLDYEAWNAMLSFTSVPFMKPKTGRIAVRIITNTFIEMTGVFVVDPKP